MAKSLALPDMVYQKRRDFKTVFVKKRPVRSKKAAGQATINIPLLDIVSASDIIIVR